MNVSVVGLGAMGGGMARSILRSDKVAKVLGFDITAEFVESFYQDAKAAGKSTEADAPVAPYELKNFVSSETNVVVLIVANEPQCNEVCFGGEEGNNLESLLAPGSCVFLCSTVAAQWVKGAYERLAKKEIQFADCPMSGGPVRAANGELTIMASGEEATLAYVDPILQAMGKEVHIIQGGPGMGNTAKMAHQLLADAHIALSGEAMALAAKAGLDVQQFYDIVKGAAGASWMFCDRAQRMIDPPEKVMSAINLCLKDMDIVYQEAKRLQCPIPIASAALQQFVSAISMGMGREDDSQIVKVYENITGVQVKRNAPQPKIEGRNIGDLWNGKEIIDVGDEPNHHIVLQNEYTRVLKVVFPKDHTCRPHMHSVDSLYILLVEGGHTALNHVFGCLPKIDCAEFGEVRFGYHVDDPLVHIVTNKNEGEMFVYDAEVKASPPVTCAEPLVAEHHTLFKTRDKVRCYQLKLEPGESCTVSYPFYYLTCVIKPATIETSIGEGPQTISWTKALVKGDLEWKTPTLNITMTNKGDTTFDQYIAEWR